MISRHGFRAFLALLVITTGSHAQEQVYSEAITVARYLVVARVLDAQGHEIRDLTADDFTITIGKEPAMVESVTWDGRPSSRAAASSASPDAEGDVEPEGRLIVFFISRDFAANALRLAGQLRFNLLADEMIAALHPGDRVAVFSHNTSLQLRIDFTTDHEAVREAIRASILADRIALPSPHEEGPSLARHLNEKAMQTAWFPEAALLQVAKAMVAMEREPAALIVGGYGMGERGGAGVVVKREGYQAMDLLRNKRVPVIAFNTGIGGQLRFGLIAAANATGGTYALATSDFPSQHLTRVAGLLAGKYELLLRTERPLESGRHPISIRVKRRGARIHAPEELVIDPSDETQLVRGEEEVLVAIPESSYVEAMRRLQDGVTDGVRELLDTAIDVEGKPAEAWYERAMLAAADGDHARAVADLRQYLARDPTGKHAADARAFLARLDR